MVYRKNLPMWERVARIVASVALIVWAVLAAPGMLFSAIAVGSAIGIIVTGLVGYCPACAMIGRKPVDEPSSSAHR